MRNSRASRRKHNAGLIISHMRGTPETWAKLAPLKDVMGTIRQDLDASAHRAVRSGVDRARIAIDPGLGFGKRKEQNAEILARLGELAALEFPLVVGPSRKSFLPQTGEAFRGLSAMRDRGRRDGRHFGRRARGSRPRCSSR